MTRRLLRWFLEWAIGFLTRRIAKLERAFLTVSAWRRPLITCDLHDCREMRAAAEKKLKELSE